MHLVLERLKGLVGRLKADPSSAEANFSLGLVHIQRGNISEALDHFKRFLLTGEDSPGLYAFLGALHRELDEPTLSLEYLERGRAASPEDFDILNNLGFTHHTLENFDAAADAFGAAARQRPDRYDVLSNQGSDLFLSGNHEQALSVLKRAESMAPSDISILLNLGYVHVALGRLGGGSDVVEKLRLFKDREDVSQFLSFYESSVIEPLVGREIVTELTMDGQHYRIQPMAIIKSLDDSNDSRRIGLSVVVPVCDEVDNIPVLCEELEKVLVGMEQESEIIFVDDGSLDGSVEVLAKIAAQNPRVTVIEFRKNYGQTAAFSAGFKYCRGDIVITMDGDLQNDPADIPRLLEKMAEGYDLVNGWRKERQDKALTRRFPSWVANKVINKLIEGTGVQLRDFGCSLKAYKKGIVKNIHLYGEMHRFIPVFAAWLGVQVAEIEVNHRPRLHGNAKYNLSRVSRVIFDLIVVRFFSDYMTRPIQFFGKIAKKLIGFGLASIASFLVLKAFFDIPISYDTLLILTALLLLSGLQILVLGLTGELLIRSYFEVQKKDHFVVKRVLNGRSE